MYLFTYLLVPDYFDVEFMLYLEYGLVVMLPRKFNVEVLYLAFVLEKR